MLSPDQLTPGSLSPDALPTSSREVLSHWAGLRRDDRPPKRTDFDPMGIARLLSNVGLVEVMRDPADFRFRLLGNTLTENMARDRTGERFRDIPNMAPGTTFWDRYAMVAETGRVNCARVDYVGANQLIRHCWDVLMPFVDQRGVVERIMVHVAFSNRGDHPI